MTNRMFPPKPVVFLLVLFCLVLASCQVPATPAQVSKNDEIQDIRVRIAQPTTRIAKVEQFPLPNCGGTDKLSQSLGSYASVTKSATLGVKAGTVAGGEVGIPATVKLKLEIQVELAYQKAYESANSRVDSINMSAAAGTHVVYAIVWEEQTFSSVVEYASDGNVYEAPYTYQLTVPKIDKSYKIDCVTNNPNPTDSIISPTLAPSTQPSVPTEPPPPTPLPSPTRVIPTPTNQIISFPDIVVSGTASKGVTFRAPADGNYIFTIKEGTYCTQPGLCRSIIHAYVNREIHWGLEFYNLPHPTQEDEELGCWENQTAENPNCGDGSSTTIFLSAGQFVRWIVMEDQNGYADNKGSVVLSVRK